jgi:2-dehydro-3-deoxyphosphogluconate aldolase/(4S)-4-hydroxy-2-oxoglutarate aldolase
VSTAGPVVARLLAARLIGIVRLDDAQLTVAAARAALEAGLGAIEVTFTLPSAPKAIEQLRGEHPDALVGAGTVRTVAQLEEADAAGAQFLVAPGLNPELLTAARKHDLLLMPGVLTASEVDLGLRLGADLLKLFPAEPLGPAYLASLMQPFPEARLIPTGGVSADNAAAYLSAGAAALAMGSSLFPARRLTEEGPAVVATLVVEALATLKPVPSPMPGGLGGGP